MVTKKKTNVKKKIKISKELITIESKILGFLGVFLPLVGLILIYLVKNDDQYALYYGRHGLALFLGWVILGALAYIPIAGIIIYTLGMLVMVILWIICLIASLSEETKKIIILTELAEKLSF